eukprot:2698824-Pleurochrysis_carterae.AAC.2
MERSIERESERNSSRERERERERESERERERARASEREREREEREKGGEREKELRPKVDRSEQFETHAKVRRRSAGSQVESNQKCCCQHAKVMEGLCTFEQAVACKLP